MKLDYAERFIKSFEDAPLPIQKAFYNRGYCSKTYVTRPCTRKSTTKLATSGKPALRGIGASTFRL